MRKFIVITAPAKGKPVIEEHTALDLDELREKLFGEKPGEEGKEHPRVFAVEIGENDAVLIPEADDLAEDGFNLVERTEFSTRTHLDVAGVERSAAGRPVDAQPGSMDAALTGMQHDAGGTVRNTVSPQPTESQVVKEQHEAGHGDLDEGAPKAAQATTK